MDETVVRDGVTFNGPLETGIRAVAVLAAAYPRSFDINRMIAYDYLLVHTSDVGGPESLHPETPLRSAQLLVRRQLVEDGLLLMMTRHLVELEISPLGIHYRAGENAAPFMVALVSDYSVALKHRARWLVDALGDRSDEAFRAVMSRFFEGWVQEFQNAERSLGAE